MAGSKSTVLVNEKFQFRLRKTAVLHDDKDALRSQTIPRFRSHTVPSFRSRTIPHFRSVLIARPSALFPIKATIATCEERS